MDQDIYRDALLAQSSGSLVGIAFRLAEIVEEVKAAGPELVAGHPAVRALVARMAWLCGLGIANTDAFYAALDDCLGQLDEDDRDEVLEIMREQAVRRILGVG